MRNPEALVCGSIQAARSAAEQMEDQPISAFVGGMMTALTMASLAPDSVDVLLAELRKVAGELLEPSTEAATAILAHDHNR